MNQSDYDRVLLKMRINPTGLRITQTPASENFYSLNGPYMIVYESCFSRSQTIQIYIHAPSYSFQFNTQSKWFDSTRSLHKHDFVEIMFVISGHILQKIETNSYEYSAGQCCLIAPGVKHTETFSEDAELFFIMLSNDFIKDILLTDHLYESDGRESKTNNMLYKIFQNIVEQKNFQKQYLDFLPVLPSDAIVPILEKYLAPITSETTHHMPGFYSMILGNTQRLLSQMINPNLYTWRIVSLENLMEESLFLQIHTILEKTHGKITRHELSEQLKYSDHYLNNIIKKNTGMSFIKYSHIFTLKEAARRLTKTDDSISEIITSLGFSNRTHFYNLFKEQYKVLPTAYRENGIPLENIDRNYIH